MIVCRHCRVRPASPPRRGLCWGCRTNRDIASLYPSTSIHAPKTDPYVPPRRTRPPAEPTPHLPGTPEKVEVLTERFAAGVDLWHAADARRG